MTTTGATETSHVGIHVRDLERSLEFYRDRLGLEVVAQWLIQEPYVREVVGYPEADLNMAVLRLPQTNAYMEVIEYRNVEGEPVDTLHGNPGTCHLAFYTDDLEETWATLAKAGSELQGEDITLIEGGVFDGGKVIYCTDPDGIRVEFLEGRAYLDGSERHPERMPKSSRANETSHAGLHVSDLERSLEFYVGQLGLEVVAKFVANDPGTRAVIGEPDADLNMAILRLPGTNAYLEVIEYQNAPGRHPVDPQQANAGTCHIAFYVDDLDATWSKLEAAGSKLVSTRVLDVPNGPMEGGKVIYCTDPDGIRVEFLEANAYLDGTQRAGTTAASV